MKKLLILLYILPLFFIVWCSDNSNNISKDEKAFFNELEKDIKAFEKNQENKEEIVKWYSSKWDYIYWDSIKLAWSTFKWFVDYWNGYAKDENFTYLCWKHKNFWNIDTDTLEFDDNWYWSDKNTYYYRGDECKSPYIIAKKIKFTNFKNESDTKTYEQLAWLEDTYYTNRWGLRSSIDFSNLYVWCAKDVKDGCRFYTEENKNKLLKEMEENWGKHYINDSYGTFSSKKITWLREFKSLTEWYLLTTKDGKRMEVLYKWKRMKTQPDLETFQKFKDGLWKDKDRMYLNWKIYNW